MFIDEHGFFTGPRPIEPQREARHPAERALVWTTLGLMLLLLVLPVSAVGLADLVHYLLG